MSHKLCALNLNFWAKTDIKYIEYERLKDVLYEFKENAPAEDSVEKSEIERYFQQSSESFFQEIEKELQKVNLFFGEKLNEAARRFTQLKVCNQMPPGNVHTKFEHGAFLSGILLKFDWNRALNSMITIERCRILSKSRRKGKIKSQNFKDKSSNK